MVERRGRAYRNVRGDEVNLDPGGIQQAVRLIGGMEAMVSSNAAAAQELKNAARELRIINERGLQMTGQRGSVATPGIAADQRSLTDTLTLALQDSLRESTAALRASLPPSMQVEVPPPAATGNNAPPGDLTPPGRTPSPAHSEDQPDPEDTNGPVREPNPGRRESRRPSAEVYEETRDYFGGKQKFNIANLRKNLGERAQGALGNATWGEQFVQDDTGAWRHQDPTAEGGLGGYADEAAVAGFLRRDKVMGALRGGTGTLAEGGTMRQAGLNMLPAGAARLAGGVGAAFYAADKIGDFAESQRAQNASWQRISGGGNLGGFEERARSKMFGLGQFGVMGEDEAARLYQGVARTGMGRDNRETAEQFAVDAYKEFGMTVEQSLEIISTAAKTGQESMLGLADSLRDVTDSARDAGINAEVARETFVNNWQTYSSVFMGPAATTMAEGFTQAQMGMGPRFQDMDLGGIANTQVLRMVGASRENPMTLNEVLAASMEPGGQGDYAEMWSQYNTEVVGGLLGNTGNRIVHDAIQGATGKDGKFKGLSEQQSIETMKELLRSNPNVDVEALISTLRDVTGVQGLELNTAMDYATQVMSGEFNPAREVRKQEREMNRASRTRMMGSGSSGFDMDNFLATGSAVSTRPGSNMSEYADLANEVRSDVSWKPWDDARQMTGAFLADVRKTQRRGGISEAIAMGDTGALADVRRVQVETEDGPRVVSIEEAMKHFRDQIDAGTAEVVEGNKAGVSVAEAMQLKGDKKVKVKSDTKEGLGDEGEDAADWRKENGQGGGNVTITPAPELMRLLQFSTSGGVSIDPSTALVPPDPHVNYNGRPSGTPGL